MSVRPFAKGLRAGMIERLSRALLPTMKECNLPALGEMQAKSTRMLLRSGCISQSSSGIYSLLPLGLKVLKKIERVVDEEMQAISAFKCSLPSLQPASLWASSGRLTAMKESMYCIGQEEGEQMVLAPTHEEEICKLVAQHVSSRHRLPLRLYQVGPKFRREQRARGGLLRLREFIMKDMYSFDVSLAAAQQTYEETRQAYASIFARLGLQAVGAQASCGDMGGRESHEYHLLADVGEDKLLICDACNTAYNAEVLSNKQCLSCGQHMKEKRGLELGHTFLLGTRYTKAMRVTFKDEHGHDTPMQMGCYGIGLSRLLAAIAEVYSDASGMAWPRIVAPYDVLLTGGQDMRAENLLDLENVAQSLSSPSSRHDLAIDDRADLSLSWRLKDAALIGVPLTIIVGRAWKESRLLELHQRGNMTLAPLETFQSILSR